MMRDMSVMHVYRHGPGVCLYTDTYVNTRVVVCVGVGAHIIMWVWVHISLCGCGCTYHYVGVGAHMWVSMWGRCGKRYIA